MFHVVHSFANACPSYRLTLAQNAIWSSFMRKKRRMKQDLFSRNTHTHKHTHCSLDARLITMFNPGDVLHVLHSASLIQPVLLFFLFILFRIFIPFSHSFLLFFLFHFPTKSKQTSHNFIRPKNSISPVKTVKFRIKYTYIFHVMR